MNATSQTVQDFLDQAWSDHAHDAEGVFARLPQGLTLAQEPAQVPQLTGLIVHVAGEHLGRWREGLALLDQLSPAGDGDPEAARALDRGRSVLQRCAGDGEAAAASEGRAHEGLELPRASTRVRILAVAASALAGQGRLAEAIQTFHEARSLAEYGPRADDPAARALAITGNNLACELEEVPARTPAQDELLELAAHTARTWWEVAGTWLEVERAEYRLAMSYLALGDSAQALVHAERCLKQCEAHEAGAVDMFFACEAMARAHHAAGAAEAGAWRERAAQAAAQVEEGARGWIAGALAKLEEDCGS